jgi:hypothetical protein
MLISTEAHDFSSEEVVYTTPARICASYDAGGGVAFRNSFAIYSIVALSPNWSRIMLDSDMYGELRDAASSVTALLPIFTSLDDTPLNLVSLSCPTRQQAVSNTSIHPRHDPPWFLINAANYSKHCILGQGSGLESLLIVLQRPWCVLELCCCDTPILAALYTFAVVAKKIDHINYHSAARILSYEMKIRQRIDNEDTSLSKTLSLIRQKYTLRSLSKANSLYADLSWGSLRSHKSFWIGMISTCAVYFDLAFSDVALMLAGILCQRLSLSDHELKETVLPRHWRSGSSKARLELSGTHYRHSRYWKRPTNSSSDSFSDSWRTNGAEWEPYGVGQTAVHDSTVDMKLLLDLYAGFLRRFGESVP